MKLLILALGLLVVSAPTLSQLLAPGTPSPCVDGSEEEYQEFIVSRGLDKLTDAQKDKLLGVSVKSCKVEDNPTVLKAAYTFQPFVVQETLCLLISYWFRRQDPAVEFDDSGAQYSAWMIDEENSCHLAEVPKRPLGVNIDEHLPTAAIKIILKSTEDLVEAALKDEHIQRRYSRVKEPINKTLFKVFNIRLSKPSPMYQSPSGVTYQVSLSDGFRHPTVSLSITEQGIDIHSFGWVEY